MDGYRGHATTMSFTRKCAESRKKRPYPSQRLFLARCSVRISAEGAPETRISNRDGLIIKLPDGINSASSKHIRRRSCDRAERIACVPYQSRVLAHYSGALPGNQLDEGERETTSAPPGGSIRKLTPRI